MTSSYAVSLLEFPAKLFSVEGVILDDHNDRNTIKIEAGMTLWIGERISAKHATFKILDYYNPDHKTQESSLFQCQLSQLQLVQDDLWPFVVAILDPQERLSFAKQQKRMLRAKQLEISKIVKVSGRPFGRTAEFFDCIIRYIGPVPEIGPGHYFGLELLNLIQGKSPQKDDLAFVSKYMKTDPELSLILAANWLDLDEYELPNNSKQTKKNFVNELFCGAKEKIKRNGKRLTDLTESYSVSREDTIGRSDTADPVGPNRNSKTPPGIVPDLEQNEVDLKDVLGENWPAAAGKTASILNTENKTTQTQPPAGYAAAVTTNGSAIMPELDQNEVERKMTSNYAVSLQEFPAKLISVEGVILDAHNDRNTITIEAGMTLWIGERTSAKHATFKILDYYNPDHKTQESSLFQCQLSQLQLVQDDLWPFVVAILDPQERLSFAKQQKRMLRAKQLEISKIVKVSGRPFGRTAEFFDCIIRYIGPVPEIGPGHYFGLELLNLIQGKSPQKDDLAFVSKYMKTEPELSLILAANWLDLDEYELPNNSKQTKKNFVNELFCGAKEKIKRNGKRLTDLTESYSVSREDTIGRSDTADPVGPNRNSKTPPGIVPDLEQNEVDLKDVLGENWPAAAGKTASILNTENKTTQTQPPAGYAAAVTTNGSAIMPELDQNEVERKMTSNYAVSLQEFPAKLISVEGVILDAHNDRNTITIEAGMTLWIGERTSAKHATFKILDYYNPDHKTQESSLFQCQLSQLQLVQDDLWPFVVAILDPQERLSFAKQQKRMLRAKQLEISKIVKVSGRPFGRTAEFFDCIIRYIGPVPEIGPGHYFGLELLNLIQGKSPQKDDLAFVSKYMKTEPELSLILAANWLDLDEYELPNNSKQTKKNFVNELFCGAKEKIKRNGKRLTDLKESYSYSREDIIGRSDTPDPVGPNRNSKTLPGIVPDLEQNEVDLKDVLGKKWPAAAGKTASILNTENKTTQTQLPAGYAAAVTTNGSAIVPELDQNEVDLKDVLGKNWSAAARKTASILNTENKATQTRPSARYAIAVATNGSVEGGKFEQNKSPNPLSNSKPSTFSFKVELKIVQDAATMADLTNDSSLNPFDNGNGPAAISSPSSSGVEPVIQPSSLKELPDNPLLEVGSLVEVDVVYAKLYGVIRWIGPLHIPGTSSSNSRVVVGIELEDKPRMAAGVEITDGVYDNVRLFDCPMNHGIFVFPVQCNQDQRFQDVYVEPQL